jgi:hypothetical protein
MTAAEVLALMEEIDLVWPGQGPAAAGDDEKVARLWLDWLRPYDYQSARRALRAFGDRQQKPPSLAQIRGWLAEAAGELPPVAEEVLAEFERVHHRAGCGTQGVIDPTWFSSPVVGVFACSGAYAEWGMSTDSAFDPELSAAEAADRASLRRLWDAFSGRVQRVGLPAVARELLAPEQLRRLGIDPAGETGLEPTT